MTKEDYLREYDRLFAWRALWTRFANTFRSGSRLQTRQEAIERRASIANGRVARLMQAYDTEHLKGVTI
jgi:hypothetical protein